MGIAPVVRRWLAPELAVFGAIGAVCLVSDVLLFNAFTFVAGMSPVAAKSVGLVITGAMAFFGHRHVTFRRRSGGGYRREISLFVLVTLATVLLSLLPLWIARNELHSRHVFWLNVANLLGIALSTLVRFFAYRNVVWSSPTARPGAAGSGGGGVRPVGVVEHAVAIDDSRTRPPLEMQHELVSE